uniref:Mandibular organ-inhibiting hormone n=1 Tax=Libinia emarginata TaxID=6807 RepID=MOIH_LIBEM|nr:RecName: Full=Mandibular organ-inhibiting hormone; Short=MOIH; Contains: RecName: Full=MOIH precursor-related peptide; Contains: RecName: Full=Mandibular organ-inhibiting hormone; Flags: Precursor [Libinia emarginata]AAD32706.1 mandibular organ inhibiting hormone preproprotein [Libinia emarginata]
MTTKCTVMAVVLAACICLQVLPQAYGRSTQGYGRMDKLLATLMGSSEGGALESASQHSLEKRQIFDPSCKGLYDRGLFSDLEHVCKDCYNLYRNPQVTSACRVNCYSNRVFRQCMEDLLLMEDFDKYARAIQTVGKK